MKHIYKFNEFLNENYDSIQEIKLFVNNCIIYITDLHIDDIIKYKTFYLTKTSILDVYQENPKKYKVISDFLVNSNVYIYFKKVKNLDTKGEYIHYSGTYNNESNRIIILYYTDEMQEDFEEDLDQTGYTKYRLYPKLYYKFNSTLSHELQHAYDDYRSKGKTFNIKNKSSKDIQSITDNNVEFDLEKYKEYLNLPFEIWARFTQTIVDNRVNFTSIIFKDIENGKTVVYHSMIPLPKVIKEFKNKYYGFNLLSEPMRRKLLSKVVQFWNIENTNLKAKNDAEIPG